MYWLLAESDPPLMPEAVSLTVRFAPLPKLTVPLPESVSPLLRLMTPPEAAVIVPWQLTGSSIEPQPPKPWPAGTVSVVPGRVDQAGGSEAAEAGGRVESGGQHQQRVGAHVYRQGADVLQRGLREVDDAIGGDERAGAAGAVEDALAGQSVGADLERAAAELVSAAAADREVVGGVRAAGSAGTRPWRRRHSRRTGWRPTTGPLH